MPKKTLAALAAALAIVAPANAGGLTKYGLVNFGATEAQIRAAYGDDKVVLLRETTHAGKPRRELGALDEIIGRKAVRKFYVDADKLTGGQIYIEYSIATGAAQSGQDCAGDIDAMASAIRSNYDIASTTGSARLRSYMLTDGGRISLAPVVTGGHSCIIMVEFATKQEAPSPF